MIFLSLKTYKQSSGDNVIKLTQVAKKVSQDTKIPIILCAQAFDIRRINQQLGVQVWAQHLDPIDPDRHSGWLSPYSAKLAGAAGTVINHAEHEIDFDTITKTIAKCQDYDLKTLVITRPDLIGSQTAMIEAEPENIKKVIDMASMPVIIGAGIQTGEHVKKTVQLGGAGVILASAVVKAQDPESALRDLASGFSN